MSSIGSSNKKAKLSSTKNKSNEQSQTGKTNNETGRWYWIDEPLSLHTTENSNRGSSPNIFQHSKKKQCNNKNRNKQVVKQKRVEIRN